MQDIILDVTRILGRGMKGRLPTGVDRVCLAYLEHFAHARLFIHIRGNGILLTPADSARLREWLLIPETDRLRILQNLPIQFSSLLRAPLSQPPRDAIFMNLGHSGVEYPRYMDWLQRHGVRPVYMVHDLIPITHPEYCRDGEVERHTLRMLTMLRTAHGIVTNSQDTLDALTTFASDHQLPLPATLVAHLGTPPSLTFSQSKRPLAEPYFIMLGTIEPRKNHLLILNIWRKLVERHGALAPKLVLIGQRGWECEQIIDMLERCPALQGSVIEYPDTSDEMLASWLHHSGPCSFRLLRKDLDCRCWKRCSSMCP